MMLDDLDNIAYSLIFIGGGLMLISCMNNSSCSYFVTGCFDDKAKQFLKNWITLKFCILRFNQQNRMPRGWSLGIWSLCDTLGGQPSSTTHKIKSTDMVESDYRSLVTRGAKKARKNILLILTHKWIVIILLLNVAISVRKITLF